MSAVAAALELDLGDAGKFFPDHITIACHRRAESVKVDLLEKVAVLERPLVALRIARVVETGAVGAPFDASAGRRIHHAGNHVVEAAAGCHIVDVRGAVLAAVGRKRHNDAFAVVGWPEEVDRGLARGVEGVEIKHDTLAADVTRRRQRHQNGLVLRRLQFQREEPPAVLEVITPHG